MSRSRNFEVEDFTAGATHDQPTRRQSTIDPPFDARVRELVADWGAEKSPELIEEMIVTALKMARDRMGTADLKLINRSLKEMRYAAKVFSGYRQFRKVCVFGSARTPPSEAQYAVAEEFAREMVAHSYMVITGGGDGIMGAAQRGAGRENGFGLNIRLPFEQQANVTIQGDPKLINFNYFFTRKLNFVKETHAFALFPGGFGTMDEGFEVLTLMQSGKARIIPVVLLDRPDGTYWQTWLKFLTEHLFRFGYISPEDFHLFKIVPNVAEGVREILHFYSVYQSSRWVGEQLVIRLSQKLSKKALADLNENFADLVRTGEIRQGSALRQEKNEPEIWSLPRLVLTPHRRSFGRFRQLIDAINVTNATS
ncbi:MAG TPA: TIGR00730 family Rossman fold protein [Chthoniobacterales bacterium]|nr:TIGR00730 family Rossman fold protein [Chthoniobacterales bacterium]